MYYFVDNTGQPLTGGFVFWYESDDHSTFKPVYKVPPTQSDPSGTPWPNPLPLNSAGFQGDNYGIWGADDKPYYVEVRVSSDPTSELILSEDNFSPPITNGGGGSNTGAADNNVLINGQFTYYTQNYNVANASIPISIPNLAPGDWFFAKSNATASDMITFPLFIPGQTDVPQNPVSYLHYSCTSPGTGETFKQIGVIFSATTLLPGSGVSNFAGQTLTLQFTAQSTISSAISINIHQNFGQGGSTQVDTPIENLTLTTSWPTSNSGNPYTITFEVPSIAGKTIATPGGILNNQGDFFSLTIDFPLNLASDIQITNLKLEVASLPSSFVADTIQQLQYKTVGLQFPPLTNVVGAPSQQNNISDGNYQVLLIDQGGFIGFIYQALAGKSELCYSVNPPFGALLCDGTPYYSYQHYNLAQASQSNPNWGKAPQSFTTTTATATITATTNIFGPVISGNSGTSGFTFTQVSNGSSSTNAVATIVCPAASSVTPGSFFLINSTIANYYVWFSLYNTTIDPGAFNPVLAGKIGVKVIYNGGETAATLASVISGALRIAQFKVPDMRGLFPRMPNHAAVGVLPQAQQLIITSAGNDTSVNFVIVGLDQFGIANTETLAGANAGTATSVNFYSAITSITPGANTVGAVQVGVVGQINCICTSQNGAASTILSINGIYQRDPDYATRYAQVTGGLTGDRVGSQQQSQNIAHDHQEANGTAGGGSPDAINAVPGNNGANSPAFNRTLNSGGNQSNPNNLYVNFIIYR